MGEYVNYKGRPVKIGTCELLYYVSYQRYKEEYGYGRLKWEEGNAFPASYLAPNVFVFRFPFPDEDNVRFGQVAAHNRTIDVSIPNNGDIVAAAKSDATKDMVIGIWGQKLVNAFPDGRLILALVVRSSVDDQLYRLEDPAQAAKVVNAICIQYIQADIAAEQKYFWTAVCARITQGYRL
ncbi:hypothetical protein MKQ70_32275 [Chitinophaga sedimenti]|uniref:hypothetical protein n=1 Tax=Chitinophaga sedimenti TaxID=2033606 RepID=UPI0020066BD9|nr:hypothetical protein [Chitinophaga sedimenti]MCK7559395.1 hypothetical protein [Chitinophaga sedimenti]